jgi:hypothetical protein
MFPLGVGEDLSHAPVDPRAAGSRAAYFSLVRGASAYSHAAGGFHQVPAMPQMQRLTLPASTAMDSNIRMTELYGSNPLLFRQRLQRMFQPGKQPASGPGS